MRVVIFIIALSIIIKFIIVTTIRISNPRQLFLLNPGLHDSVLSRGNNGINPITGMIDNSMFRSPRDKALIWDPAVA